MGFCLFVVLVTQKWAHSWLGRDNNPNSKPRALGLLGFVAAAQQLSEETSATLAPLSAYADLQSPSFLPWPLEACLDVHSLLPLPGLLASDLHVCLGDSFLSHSRNVMKYG